jgi:hypothetical protein
MMLAVANEFDAVVRADRSYLNSLIKLHNSSKQTVFALESSNSFSVRSGSDSDVSFTSGDEMSESFLEIKQAKKMWPLPPPEYYPIGDIVVLKVSLPETPDPEDPFAIALKAFKVHPVIFSNLVFCNTEVHRRVQYTKRVKMILEGKFNNGTTWHEGGHAAVGWKEQEEQQHMNDVLNLINNSIE